MIDDAIPNRPTTDGSRAQALKNLSGVYQQLVDAFDVLPEGIALFDADDRYVLWNERYVEIYESIAGSIVVGARFEDVVRDALTKGLILDAVGQEEEWLAKRLADHRRASHTYEHHLSNDKWIRVQERRTSDGGRVSVRTDITELKEREASFRFLFESNPIPMFACDAKNLAFLEVNDAAVAYYGYSREQFSAMSVFDLRRRDDREDLWQRLRAGATGRQNGEVRRHAKADGTPIDVAVYSKPMRYRGAPAVIVAAIDVTERLEAQRQIEYLAHHDTLTALPNRASFNNYLSNAIESSAQRGTKLAVLCVDLDRFKEVNDVFGHAAGDKLLKVVAERFKSIANDAFTARLGGDEFAIVVTDDEQPRAAEELAARLQAAMTGAIEVDGHLVVSCISIGVAVYPSDGVDLAQLLANGDAALYRAKREGRGCICFFDAEMDRQIRERRVLQHELRSAVEQNEIRIFYQPQARISGEIIGFEALARWQHPRCGLISANVFIPLAEDGGLIMQLGEHMLREACREAATWTQPLQLAVNLSAVQFRHGDLPALVHGVLMETGLAPERLELEITESVLIDDFGRAISILRRLKALGVKIAMDDFGTGYSSLSYLHSFPFDKIKIDQSFIMRLNENPQSPAIIRAVIGLAHGLSLPVLAEGVETTDQLAFLKREACDQVQGFLVGRPKDIGEYAEVIGMPNRAVPKASAAGRSMR